MRCSPTAASVSRPSTCCSSASARSCGRRTATTARRTSSSTWNGSARGSAGDRPAAIWRAQWPFDENAPNRFQRASGHNGGGAMSRRLEIFQVDAFTDVPFKGNPAGVVLGADALRAVEMQAIARELNNPVSAFVLEPESTDHDFRIRFFTPTTEVSMCGHATIAANQVRALRAGAPELRATQKTRAGLVAVDVRTSEGRAEVWMTLPVLETGRSL